MQKRWFLGLVAALSLGAASAQALPTGPLVSLDGQLEFSNFQFFSPFGTVDEDEVTLTVLQDGIRLSGPITASDDEVKSFFVLYEVRGINADIEEVSMLLESDVDADKFGLVLATKQILGEKKKHGKSGRRDDDWHKGWGRHDDRGKHGKGKGHRNHDHDDDFNFNFDRKTLAFLKTADWEIGKRSKFDPPFSGLGRDGAVRLVEAGFDPQERIRVIESFLIAAHDGDEATWEISDNRFQVVPEPGTAALMVLGLAGLARRTRRNR